MSSAFLIWCVHPNFLFTRASSSCQPRRRSAEPLSLSLSLSPRTAQAFIFRDTLSFPSLLCGSNCAWDLLTHPTELRAVIRYTIWHEPLHPRDPSKESDDVRRCYTLLKKTSRSFVMVLEELHPELRTPVLPNTARQIPPFSPCCLLSLFRGVADVVRSCCF